MLGVPLCRYLNRVPTVNTFGTAKWPHIINVRVPWEGGSSELPRNFLWFCSGSYNAPVMGRGGAIKCENRSKILKHYSYICGLTLWDPGRYFQKVVSMFRNFVVTILGENDLLF